MTAIRVLGVMLVLGAVLFALPAHADGGTVAPSVEVVLLMGQSGMVGIDRTTPDPARPVDQRVQFWTGHLGATWWGPAREPMHGDGYGVGTDFGQHLLTIRPSVHSVMLVPCAVSGSTTERWVPGGDLYQRCLGLALASGLRPTGALVYQGGSDAATLDGALAWPARFTSLVDGLRAEYGAIPVVYGQLGDAPAPGGDFPHWNQVRDAQAGLSLPGVVMVPTDDLWRMDDDIHFTWYSALTVGQRMARAYAGLRG